MVELIRRKLSRVGLIFRRLRATEAGNGTAIGGATPAESVSVSGKSRGGTGLCCWMRAAAPTGGTGGQPCRDTIWRLAAGETRPATNWWWPLPPPPPFGEWAALGGRWRSEAADGER